MRTAEDTWVDDLWSDAVDMGAPLLAATFPRAYIDANRAPDEIDELLLDRPWPGAVNASPKVRLGKGLIWRMLDDGTPLYDRKLPVEEVEHRIAACWKPYHAALRQLLDGAHRKFGKVWHIIPPLHAQRGRRLRHRPARPGPPRFRAGRPRRQHQRPGLPRIHRGLARARGYHVTVNDPYKGVELVRAFGCPAGPPQPADRDQPQALHG
ncbi:N-formylglutamate amidohydrolase [Achromobacter xylosoxidans]